MKKKKYLKPEIKTLNIEGESLLAASGPREGQPNQPSTAKSSGFLDFGASDDAVSPSSSKNIFDDEEW